MIYLDYAASTPDLTPYSSLHQWAMKDFGNPSSSHAQGRAVREVIDKARRDIADYLICRPHQLIFTSGATEANNMAIMGWLLNNTYDNLCHILCSPTAHHSMIEPVARSPKFGGTKVTYLPVTTEGLINEDLLENLLASWQTDNIPVLACFEWVNNETGVVQDARSLVQLFHKYGIKVLIDAVQVLPTMRPDIYDVDADYMTFSAHKIYGPKGVGLLYCRDCATLSPLMVGGSQEGGLRAGTENVVGILGFAHAIDYLRTHLANDAMVLNELHKRLQKIAIAYGLTINGAVGHNHSPAILNLNCGVEGSALAQMLENEGFLVSTGAACSGEAEVSHVLMAMGLREAASNSIRVSLSARITTEEHIEEFGKALAKCIKELKV